MTGVLKPGVRLLERFSFARKFQLLFVLFILPLAYALWVISSDHLGRLALIDNELEGMQGVQAIGAVQRAVLDQRTLLARWKGTDTAAEALLREREGALDEAITTATAQLQGEMLSTQTQQHLSALQALRPDLAAAGLTKGIR